MQVLADGFVRVDYNQAYVRRRDHMPDNPFDGAFEGQANGIIGAAIPGFLCLAIGTRSGEVHFTVRLHQHQPALKSDGDVVEVDLDAGRSGLELQGWGGASSAELNLPEGRYRVRYTAARMDAGRAAIADSHGGPVSERCHLDLWSSEPEGERIVRVSSRFAQEFHALALSKCDQRLA